MILSSDIGPQSRVPLPNILPFAAYAHRRAARGSVPDYVRATAAAPEMAAFAGVGGSELLSVIETQFLREQQQRQQQQQQGRHSHSSAESSGPDSVADFLALPSIRANAVLVLLNRTNGSGASVAFTAADQNVLQVRGREFCALSVVANPAACDFLVLKLLLMHIFASVAVSLVVHFLLYPRRRFRTLCRSSCGAHTCRACITASGKRRGRFCSDATPSCAERPCAF
jgi:hypothetical protein